MEVKEKPHFLDDKSYEECVKLRDDLYKNLQILYYFRNSVIAAEGSFEELEKIDVVIQRIKYYFVDCISETSKKYDITPAELRNAREMVIQYHNLIESDLL